MSIEAIRVYITNVVIIYKNYITESMARGTIGSKISLGILAFIGVLAVLGAYTGVSRGFSKSVIRLFTVGASAVGALYLVITISKAIVNTATAGGSAQTVEGLLNSYFPGLVDSMPSMVRPILAEMSTGAATIFVMMLVAIILSPIFFILFFYTLRFASLFIYQLLSGLSGAISYGRSVASMIGGGVVGLIQGVLIAAVIIVPIGGMFNVAKEAREPLIGKSEEPNAYIQMAYDMVIDDVADNPVFGTISKFGGSIAYEKMISVTINGEKKDMGDECVSAIKVISNLFPFISSYSDFNWKHPTATERDAIEGTVEAIGDNELLATLISDIIRAAAVSVNSGEIAIPVSGAAKPLLDDVMIMLSTCTKDTIEGDLDVIVDVYFILCDRSLFDAFTSHDPEALRHVLVDKDAEGNTAIDSLVNRLNQYDRTTPLVTALTKLSFTMMGDALGFDSDTTEIYENVKEGMKDVLNHNKSDFETEEKYKEAVYEDLDKALTENDLNLDEETKKVMVDYIADNYGDHEGEITDKEINDALLSYYKAYADSLAGGGDTGTEENPAIPGLPLPDDGNGDIPGINIPEGGLDNIPEGGMEE